jgi:ABC-type multidrug transport system ATPase subunit
VLAIFSRLNAEGRTVVLITHEPDVAAQTRRVVRLSDGRIVEDERLRELPPRPAERRERRASPPPSIASVGQ